MLIQLPSGSPDQPGPQGGEQTKTFEAGLRRDLASAPVVSYDAMLGGVAKRAIDLALTILTGPLWLSAVAIAALWLKARHRRQALINDERIGYGGRTFNCLSLNLTPPAVLDVAASAAANDVGAVVSRKERWHSALQRLPRLLNVLAGDMALVGPLPLTRAQLEPLKSARRYYLSARPGVIGVSTLIGSDDPSQFKVYAMSWDFSTDALILWDALRSLWTREALWSPSFSRGAPGVSISGVVVRRREGD